MTKTGTGKWVLSHNNSYGGDTTVSAGALQLTGLNTANDGSTIKIASGATLNLSFAGTERVGRLASGSNWTKVGSTTGTTFASNCNIGLAVGSGSYTTLNTSQFSNLSVTP